ncbi:protein-L-isoaspartate(D-aspartate) O-methyltransferase [Maritimibacter alkaliphilus HTCC2654]|jgi:protein-L-isoaspartate(D-aspartate) O-methyltransferase|uniref:Protein-L-isoaspartate O-methyltransferase n=1 Tax=Maritimibacter alkaliphilus HTCC2654 TaxID=314271 RepID=A3VA77_9RHOB|nr:protein-L-isoaspartate O-methyltransferase [Maritimibacter alkaliphilus]EAQ14818.1 Protein-L-isoaspartate carboxylmethyltransferase [Maritimibacter alkaliphilus HTCC2654]TYP80954.1 protein-L-isoaspartate(D-aspartate) O-methyltransferase [Maritimibacter alkaliphilus HTCC2654]
MSDFQTRRTMMVDTQVRPSDVTKYPIIDAMLTVPREDFVPDDQREAAYTETQIELAPGRVMLEPRSFAKILDALSIQPTELVLTVGAGLGYGAAVLARLADFVVAVEEDDGLAGEAEGRLASDGVDNVAVIKAPLVDGAAKHGPYDVILIEGAVETLPATLTDQLRENGRIAALFTEGNLGIVKVGYKIDGAVNWRFAFNASAPVLPGFTKTKDFAL